MQSQYIENMKKLFVFALLAMLSVFAMAQNAKKVAILETVDKENKVAYGVKLQLRSSLTYAISSTPGYEGYDRVDMSSILGEHNFQRTGYVSDAQIKKLGEMTGASSILVAEAAIYDASHIIVTAKILNVETASVENSAPPQIAGTDPEAMQNACNQLAAKLLGSSSGGGSGRTGSNTYSHGQNFTETAFGINMKMIYVEGGTFTMGCTGEQGSECEDDESPNRRTTVSSFYIGMLEVTQSQWEAVMGTTIYQQKAKANASNTYGTGADYPMYYVSWEEAKEFCLRLSRQTGKTYRLPTEAEWEYAARGGNKNEGTKYSGGWSMGSVGWYDGNSNNSTHPCGTKMGNALGIYDMSGNVWEWCEDWYGPYLAYDTDNPKGASSGSYRVFRGGSWHSYAESCRVSDRGMNSPGDRCYNRGFRVVLIP